MDAPATTPPELLPPPPSPGTIELEIHRLDRCYAHLRVTEPEALGRLVCSLSMRGQCHPVVVVQRQGARYALIDGYRRVVALERLCRDTVKALVLGLEEPEALTYCHQRVCCFPRFFVTCFSHLVVMTGSAVLTIGRWRIEPRKVGKRRRVAQNGMSSSEARRVARRAAS
jgi:hypothetical protein